MATRPLLGEWNLSSSSHAWDLLFYFSAFTEIEHTVGLALCFVCLRWRQCWMSSIFGVNLCFPYTVLSYSLPFGCTFPWRPNMNNPPSRSKARTQIASSLCWSDSTSFRPIQKVRRGTVEILVPLAASPLLPPTFLIPFLKIVFSETSLENEEAGNRKRRSDSPPRQSMNDCWHCLYSLSCPFLHASLQSVSCRRVHELVSFRPLIT